MAKNMNDEVMNVPYPPKYASNRKLFHSSICDTMNDDDQIEHVENM